MIADVQRTVRPPHISRSKAMPLTEAAKRTELNKEGELLRRYHPEEAVRARRILRGRYGGAENPYAHKLELVPCCPFER